MEPLTGTFATQAYRSEGGRSGHNSDSSIAGRGPRDAAQRPGPDHSGSGAYVRRRPGTPTATLITAGLGWIELAPDKSAKAKLVIKGSFHYP